MKALTHTQILVKIPVLYKNKIFYEQKDITARIFYMRY